MVPLKASLRDVLGTVLLISISHDLIKNADSPRIFFHFQFVRRSKQSRRMHRIRKFHSPLSNVWSGRHLLTRPLIEIVE